MALCLRIFLILSYSGQLMIQGVNFIIGHERTASRQQIKLCCQVILSLLYSG